MKGKRRRKETPSRSRHRHAKMHHLEDLRVSAHAAAVDWIGGSVSVLADPLALFHIDSYAACAHVHQSEDGQGSKRDGHPEYGE